MAHYAKDLQRRLKVTAGILNDGEMDPGTIDGVVGERTLRAVDRVCTYAEGRAPVEPIVPARDPAPLLTYLRRHEADGAVQRQGVASAYDVVWGGINHMDRPQNRVGKPLTRLTVQEVLDWQDSIDAKYMSEAAGGYQIMEDTLRPLGHRGELFTADLQDRLALRLMDWQNLQNSPARLALKLAKTWASVPVLQPMQGRYKWLIRGESYYTGDGLNRANPEAADELEAVLAEVLTPTS